MPSDRSCTRCGGSVALQDAVEDPSRSSGELPKLLHIPCALDEVEDLTRNASLLLVAIKAQRKGLVYG